MCLYRLFSLAPSGVEIIYATKVVGHHVLAMELVKKNSFNSNPNILFVGAEASTGAAHGDELSAV